MKPPRWPHLFRQLRRHLRAASPRTRATLLAAAGVLAFFVLLRAWFWRAEQGDDELLLFIAIGSAPQNVRLRSAARETWLRRLPNDGSVRYRFFSDAPPFYRGGGARGGDEFETGAEWSELVREARVQHDVLLQPLPGGHGDNEHNVYASRALYQIHWTLRHFPNVKYFLRVDDDSFLCVDKLLYELSNVPKQQFFWGKFWCREGRNRADENFMLFSADVIQLLSSEHVGKLIPFDEHVTLGWNFGYWSWIFNMSIFDDQLRIDAQQSYLTKYMHDEKLASNFTDDFCQRYLFAHHVVEGAMRRAYNNWRAHVMYKLPELVGPDQTCGSEERSFIPKRHSLLLPDVKISRTSSALT
ncbi:Glycosyltransferase family GT23 [Gracilaria domingensis]|nr:Glycosyltransferase family GT23 [Gracilaria domingensis]